MLLPHNTPPINKCEGHETEKLFGIRQARPCEPHPPTEAQRMPLAPRRQIVTYLLCTRDMIDSATQNCNIMSSFGQRPDQETRGTQFRR